MLVISSGRVKFEAWSVGIPGIMGDWYGLSGRREDVQSVPHAVLELVYLHIKHIGSWRRLLRAEVQSCDSCKDRTCW